MAGKFTTSRLSFLAFWLLSFALLTCASPVKPRDDTSAGEHCHNGTCFGGMNITTLMGQLQTNVESQLVLLDQCLDGAGDRVQVITNLEGLLNAAGGAIGAYNSSQIALFDGTLMGVASVWTSVVISIATHCEKWSVKNDFEVFLGLCAKLDVALKLCLTAIVKLGGIFGTILSVLVGLFTQVQFALLAKVKFALCLALLGH